MTRPATLLRLDAHRVTLSGGDGAEAVIGVGVQDILERCFRHHPPAAVEVERAIDLVEDALSASGLVHGARGELAIVGPLPLAALGLTDDGMRLSRDAVEARFERLAAAALGQPGAAAGMALDAPAAAALLILRECLHHLGYEGVRRTDA